MCAHSNLFQYCKTLEVLIYSHAYIFDNDTSDKIYSTTCCGLIWVHVTVDFAFKIYFNNIFCSQPNITEHLFLFKYGAIKSKWILNKNTDICTFYIIYFCIICTCFNFKSYLLSLPVCRLQRLTFCHVYVFVWDNCIKTCPTD